MEDFKAEGYHNLKSDYSLGTHDVPVVAGDCPHGNHVDGEVTACSAEDLHTWLGGVACDIAGNEGAPGDYISTFTSPEPATPMEHGTRTRWTGMVTASHICFILRTAR
jgi:hypothetical protein